MNTRRNIVFSAGPIARALAVFVLTVFSLAGTGCGLLGLDNPDGAAPPTPTAQKQAAAPAGASAQLKAAEEEYERPDYPDNVRRNPFLPDLDIIQPTHSVAQGDVRPMQPLEMYSLSQLSLVAIISEVAVPKAMFLDPNGFGHVVKEGDRVGQNGGTITDIRDNEVEVREVTDEEDTQTRLSTVKLRDQQLETTEDQGLSDQEREALRKLLASQEGRAALQQSLKSDGASAGAQGPPGGGLLPPSAPQP